MMSGKSMIIDPLGKVLTQASATDEEIITAEFEREAVIRARTVSPGPGPPSRCLRRNREGHGRASLLIPAERPDDPPTAGVRHLSPDSPLDQWNSS